MRNNSGPPTDGVAAEDCGRLSQPHAQSVENDRCLAGRAGREGAFHRAGWTGGGASQGGPDGRGALRECGPESPCTKPMRCPCMAKATPSSARRFQAIASAINCVDSVGRAAVLSRRIGGRLSPAAVFAAREDTRPPARSIYFVAASIRGPRRSPARQVRRVRPVWQIRRARPARQVRRVRPVWQIRRVRPVWQVRRARPFP